MMTQTPSPAVEPWRKFRNTERGKALQEEQKQISTPSSPREALVQQMFDAMHSAGPERMLFHEDPAAKYLFEDLNKKFDLLEKSPEHALMIAVFVSGITECLKTVYRVSNCQRKARAWVLSEDRDHIYSFLNICDHLGFCPDRWRRLLQHAVANNLRIRKQRAKLNSAGGHRHKVRDFAHEET